MRITSTYIFILCENNQVIVMEKNIGLQLEYIDTYLPRVSPRSLYIAGDQLFLSAGDTCL